MQFNHKIDNFLFTIFPHLKEADNETIISALIGYYTYGPYKPKVTINNDTVTIDVDTPAILTQEADYKKVVSLCEKGRYNEAKPILRKLIEKNPSNSEYHRIMGQVLSDEGDQEEAINYLIDALRWDSKNGWALLMMGNIFAKYKADIPTAIKYYDQALVANTKDNISLTNIGYVLMQQGKYEDAKKYLWEALKINSDYPNAHLTLGIIADKEDDLGSAFFSTVQAIRLSNTKDVIYQNAVKQAFQLANRLIASGVGKKIFREYRHKLEFDGGTEVDIVAKSNIPTAARIEFAEIYNRTKHIIRHKPDYPAVEHLIMHELVHLDFVIQARKEELNQLFTATQQHRNDFIKGLDQNIKRLKKMNIPLEAIDKYCTSLFDGMNLQAFNTPIDLFIETFLYNDFVELRPYQFLSLYTLVQQGLKAVTDKKTVDISPADILSKSKVYNIVNALHFKHLFGIDLIKDFQATQAELKQANGFYDEYLQYKDDKEPGEEYELVLHWAEDLNLDKNFELVDEKEYRTKRTDIDNLLSSIEKDPYDIDTKSPYKEREMEKFQKSQEKVGTNMAVAMFMVDALKYFDKMPEEEIKKIAFEIATNGTQGYRPDKSDYRISFIPGKLFSGYHILAYYYVSWMLVLPNMVPQLQLPFDEEYKLALSMYKLE